MHRLSFVTAGLVAVVLLSGCQATSTGASDGDRVQRIRSAAVEIAGVQKAKGNYGALDAVAACYSAAKGKNVDAAEVCATQDYVISKVSLALLSQLGEAGKNDSSYKIATGATNRITAILSSEGRNQQEIREFFRLAEQQGLPAFSQARF